MQSHLKDEPLDGAGGLDDLLVQAQLHPGPRPRRRSPREPPPPGRRFGGPVGAVPVPTGLSQSQFPRFFFHRRFCSFVLVGSPDRRGCPWMPSMHRIQRIQQQTLGSRESATARSNGDVLPVGRGQAPLPLRGLAERRMGENPRPPESENRVQP